MTQPSKLERCAKDQIPLESVGELKPDLIISVFRGRLEAQSLVDLVDAVGASAIRFSPVDVLVQPGELRFHAAVRSPCSQKLHDGLAQR